MKGYRKVLIAMNGSTDVVKEGIKMAQDEKTWVTVLKVIPENEGDLNLTGIRNLEDVLDSGARKALAEARGVANAESALIRTRLSLAHKSSSWAIWAFDTFKPRRYR